MTSSALIPSERPGRLSPLSSSGSIAEEMPRPKPNKTYRILFSGDTRCGKTSVRARIAGQALPTYIQLNLLHDFPLVECLVPKGDPNIDEEVRKGWQAGAVEGLHEGGVGGGRRADTGKRRVMVETQENSLGKCYDGLEGLNFVGMGVIAVCFSIGMKDTFDERLQVVSGIHSLF
jgi:hypothetical protein